MMFLLFILIYGITERRNKGLMHNFRGKIGNHLPYVYKAKINVKRFKSTKSEKNELWLSIFAPPFLYTLNFCIANCPTNII